MRRNPRTGYWLLVVDNGHKARIASFVTDSRDRWSWLAAARRLDGMTTEWTTKQWSAKWNRRMGI